jgi:hypothetical protein
MMLARSPPPSLPTCRAVNQGTHHAPRASPPITLIGKKLSLMRQVNWLLCPHPIPCYPAREFAS